MEGDSAQVPTTSSLLHIMNCNIDELPAQCSKLVRIFTSSTFTDTALERNLLMENVYPKIKDYCRERHGLEFQVVDMRWGVRDEATDDHMTTDLCLNEIDNCQRLSTGPNFCVFLSQKYGYRPLPSQILASEFDMLQSVIETVPDDCQLLNQWYKLDTNAVPPVRVLQPISSILTNFNNKRHQKLMKDDQKAWWSIMSKLQRMLRKAALVLHKAGKLNDDEMHNYFMSVTEREIRRAVTSVSQSRDHCLAYIRYINNINTAASKSAQLFVDMFMTSRLEIDSEANSLMHELRENLLPSRFAETNISRFNVDWVGLDGLDRNSHAEYLSQFTDIFYKQVIELVDRAVDASIRLANDRVYTEVLQHLHACRNFCQTFQGRQEIIAKIERYVVSVGKKDSNRQKPLMLYGESGCGKTSLLAKAYSQVHHWLRSRPNCEPVLMLRFLGTSPDSSSLIPLLTSLCQQISAVYGKPVDTIPTVLSALLLHFKQLVELATVERPLVIFLDSLDQLSAEDGAHQLAWLPDTVSAQCRVIASTLTNYDGILDAFRLLVNDSPSHLIEVTPLGQNLGTTIIQIWLNDAHRMVTSQQWAVVQQALNRCNLPLYVKLVFDEISRWRSYHVTSNSQQALAHTIHDCIMKLFERVESQHGRVLVSHALGYITAAKGGLSAAELEDVLSLDEKVLNDVYQYHVPPVRRIPPLLWTRLRNDLPHYLSEREADGVTVISWYHRQFVEAARERYFRNVNFVEETHSLLADYFSGRWGGTAVLKPFQYTELQRQRFGLASVHGAADRKVPEQPLYFVDQQSGKVSRYNLRKLSELPYHLTRAHRCHELYHEVLFNYQWLHAKLSSMSLQSILADFDDALCHDFIKNDSSMQENQRDAGLLVDALRLSSSVLSRYPDMLAPQIVGRLLPYYQSRPMIHSLLVQCDSKDKGLRVNALTPAFHCLHTPGGPLQFSLEAHPFAPFGVALTSDAKYLVSVSSIVVVWHMATGDIFRQLDPGVQGIMQTVSVSPDDKYAVSYTNNNQLVICVILTGEYRVLQQVVDSRHGDIVGLTTSNRHCVIWTRLGYWRCVPLSVANTPGLSAVDDSLMVTNGCIPAVKKLSIIYMALFGNERFVITKVEDPIPGAESDTDMTLEIFDTLSGRPVLEGFQFHSAVAMTADRCSLYTCVDISGNDVTFYERTKSRWRYVDTLPGDNTDPVSVLTLSTDGRLLVATVPNGHKIWCVTDRPKLVTAADVVAAVSADGPTLLRLPEGLRNIPVKTCSPLSNSGGLLAVVNNGQYVVSAVRNALYVWHLGTASTGGGGGGGYGGAGEKLPVKTLDAHFSRIMSLVTVTGGRDKDDHCHVISSSIDKSIKVWNLHSIDHDVHAIQRLGKPVDEITLTSDGNLALATTRAGLSLWNLADGRLIRNIPISHSSSQQGFRVTHAAITSDGLYMIAAETGGRLSSWEVATGRQIYTANNPQAGEIQQIIIKTCQEQVIVVARSASDVLTTCTCRTVASDSTVYQFTYRAIQSTLFYKDAVVTVDGSSVVVATMAVDPTNVASQEASSSSSSSGDNTVTNSSMYNLQLFNSSTGQHQCNITLKYANFRPFLRIVALKAEQQNQQFVALIDEEKGNIIDVRRRSGTFVRSVSRWNGVCSSNGKLGLYAPDRGGLELIDLQNGQTTHCLIPRVAEGVFSTISLFTGNDQHVIYYHSGRRSIRLFRVSDGKQIADYKMHADVRAMTSTTDGFGVVVGAVDGSVVMLAIADPDVDDNVQFLNSLPSRSGK